MTKTEIKLYLNADELHFLRHLVEKHREDYLYITREKQNLLLLDIKNTLHILENSEEYEKEILEDQCFSDPTYSSLFVDK